MSQEKQEIMVNICCITYNREFYIRDALDGFLKQEMDFVYGILIHDDASTDKTGEIIREYVECYPEVIKPILQTGSQYSKGSTDISGTFNFPKVAGWYVATCEGNDYWADGKKLQLQVDYVESHPDYVLCPHNAEMKVLERVIVERAIRPYRGGKTISPKETVGERSGYPTAFLLFRMEMVRGLSEFYINAPVADIPLQLLAAARGYRYYMDRSMCAYRLGEAMSWTSTMKQGDHEERQRRYFTQVEEMHRGFDREGGGRLHEAVERAMERLYFLTQVNARHYNIVLAKRNRESYRELNGRTRFFIRLGMGMPQLYHWLQRLMHRG